MDEHYPTLPSTPDWEIHLDEVDATHRGAPWQMTRDSVQVDYRQLTSGKSAGVTQLRLTTPEFQATWVPTRGLGLAEVRLDDLRIGWQSPVAGPVHPHWVPLSEPSGLGWLDGFDELLVRCGLENNGAPQFGPHGELQLPLHGRIANTPATAVAVRGFAAGVEVVAEVTEARFHFYRWRLTTRYFLPRGRRQIQVSDQVTNAAGRLRDFQMLYHFNLGSPLLAPGSRLHIPVRQVVPRDAVAAAGVATWDQITVPRAGQPEQVFLCEPLPDSRGWCRAVLPNPEGSAAAAISFPVAQLPCFTFWKNMAAVADGYVVGLEPGTNFPNPKNFEQAQGRTVALAPDETCDIHWALNFSRQPREIAEWLQEVRQLQAGQACRVFTTPQPGWSMTADAV